MADIIKKATRESYGEALRDLAEEYKDLVVLDADLLQRQAFSRRHILTVSLTAVSQKQI